MSEQPIQPPVPVSLLKSAVPLALGIVSVVCLVVFALIFFFGDRLDSELEIWLILPSLSFVAGGVATPLGAVGWADARKGDYREGLRQAQWGTILGGLSIALITIAVIVLLIAFLVFAASWNEGVDSTRGGGFD